MGALTEEAIALMLLAFAMVVAFGAMGRWLAERVGQTAVLGELLMGVVVGNYMRLLHWPALDPFFYPPEHWLSIPLSEFGVSAFALWVFAQLGILFLLFQIG